MWCEGDNCINVVSDNGEIIIHINERIVGRYMMGSGTPKLWSHDLVIDDGDVHTAMLAFIDKWGIGV
ncbi:hypothetical protein Xoosp13_140 [Xanthomonas phage Xoo-sp13]|nr:hypothetical protein Xoosp13_140 [Xanthomonas phage Xoo-sp13]